MRLWVLYKPNGECWCLNFSSNFWLGLKHFQSSCHGLWFQYQFCYKSFCKDIQISHMHVIALVLGKILLISSIIKVFVVLIRICPNVQVREELLYNFMGLLFKIVPYLYTSTFQFSGPPFYFCPQAKNWLLLLIVPYLVPICRRTHSKKPRWLLVIEWEWL